jgi:hypothetical protein
MSNNVGVDQLAWAYRLNALGLGGLPLSSFELETTLAHTQKIFKDYKG